MTKCNICLGDDYDPPQFYNERVVKARKPYTCCECHRPINKGQQHRLATGKWEGELGSYRTCMDCYHIREAFRCGGGFFHERLWEDLSEYQNDLNAHCVAKIKTVSAKEYFLERLRKWRGLQ